METSSDRSQAACTAIRAVLAPFPEITQETLEVICEIVTGNQERVKKFREALATECETPMSVAEACRLLGFSRAALFYHCRAGRIRRCFIPGALRARGVVAADVRKILEGRAEK